MAKRYGNSKRGHGADRFNDEHRNQQDGGFIWDGRNEPYAGNDARRTQEMEDAGMIRENMSQVANLPQEVMMKPYPKTGPYMPEGIDDDISGVDRQMDFDDRQRKSHWYPKKV